MSNPWRGEVVLEVDGQSHRMRLSLGVLAELESQMESGSIVEMVERFEANRVRARDLLDLLAAGLRGGGFEISADELGQKQIEGGPVVAARAAAELLRVTFSVPVDE